MAKIFRNYNTLSQFNYESVHPENKICFIKDKGVLYLNGVQYSPSKMDTIANIGDSNSIVDKFNELRNNLLKSNLMAARTPYIYWTGDPYIIISGTSYTAQADKVNIGGVEYYQLKLDKDLDNDFYQFSNITFTNLLFKDVDTSNVTNMTAMFYDCSSLTSLDVSGLNTSNVTDMTAMLYRCSSIISLDLSGWDISNNTNMSSMFGLCNALKTIRMVGCSQTTIDKIKAQLSSDGIIDCTIVTE